MKTAKSLFTLIVLAVASCFVPGAGAQSTGGQKPPMQRPPMQHPPVQRPLMQHPPMQRPLTQRPVVRRGAMEKPPMHALEARKREMRPPIQHARVRGERPHTAAVAVMPAQPQAQTEAPRPVNTEALVSRRDPFSPLVAVSTGTGTLEHLPPGKAGLVIGTVHVDGALKSPNGMIAVVSNPQERVYFVHVGDRLYDGDVQKISLDGVTFRENSKDAFGKPVERLVTKRIYPNAGEQQ